MKVIDHLGNEFKTKKEMCDYWGVTVTAAQSRSRDGWSLEKILTTPVKSTSGKISEDHLGNKYSTEREMCKFYNIEVTLFRCRINDLNWSLEDALTIPAKDRRCIDHLGNEFKNKKEMYKYWGITERMGDARSRDGWSLEKILTTPHKELNKYFDPTDQNWYTVKELSEKYQIAEGYIRSGLLERKIPFVRFFISTHIPPKTINPNRKIYNLTVEKRIKKGVDVFECHIDNGDGTSTFRIMSYEMIDEYCVEQYKKIHNIS